MRVILRNNNDKRYLAEMMNEMVCFSNKFRIWILAAENRYKTKKRTESD